MTELPMGWTSVKLSEVTPPDATIIYGILQPGPHRPDGVPYVRPTEIDAGQINLQKIRRTSPDIAAKYRRAALQAGDVLLSIVGTIGKVAIAPPELEGGNITQSSCRIRPDPSLISSNFVSQFLRSPLAAAAYKNARLGTAVPRLNLEDVRKIEMPLPPLVEQRRISERIDAVLQKVDVCRGRLDRVPQLMKRFRDAVLAAGCTGRLTIDFRENMGCSDVLAALSSVASPPRPSRYNSRTTRLLPGRYALSVGNPETELALGWHWTPLVDIARMESGHTPSRSHPEYWDGNIPWISIPDARDWHGKTIPDTYQKTTPKGLANSAARLLPTGTVCLSRTASVGYVVRMGRSMATSQDFVNWTCTPVLDPDFLKYVLMAEGEGIRRFGEGSTHTTIYFPELLSLHVALPPIEEQQEIVRRIDQLLALGESLERRHSEAASRIEKLTPSVLAKAFRGRLVAQDPNEEPAGVLLERVRILRSENAAAASGVRRRAAAPRKKRITGEVRMRRSFGA